MADTMPFGVLDELDPERGARAVAIHEFGHGLGADHELDLASIMGGTKIKVGGRSVSSVGSRTQSILPDDAHFAVDFHASGSSGYPDVLVSPWYKTGVGEGKYALRYAATNPALAVCPGATVQVSFALGNIGKVAVTSQIDVVLSTNATITTSDPSVWQGFWYGALGAWDQNATASFAVPNLTAGVYYVGVIADAGNSVAEDYEYNNAMKSGLRVQIRSSGC